VLLLALDTATPALTVALHDGSRTLAGQTLVSTRKHGELLAAMIEQVLAAGGAGRGDLEAIAVGTGPGPYTGLRAGLVTARVLASALGIPVVGVCTLDVIARSAVEAAAGREFLVASDARRKEVYWARYAADGQRTAGPEVSSAVVLGGNDLPYNPPAAEVPVAGEGPVLYPEMTKEAIPPLYPDAGQLGLMAAELLAAGGPLEPVVPLYLRRPDAQVPGKPKRVTP
jgi:tRNA threonylcarbamoyl adenosine modification protein YeaZ